jgi:hypothetical protein
MAMSDFDPFPNMYSDYSQVHDYATWPMEALNERLTSYVDFIRREDLMPRALSVAALIIEHLAFEIDWRGRQTLEIEDGTPEQ